MHRRGRPKVSLKSKEFRFVSKVFAMTKEDASKTNSTNFLNVKAAHFRAIYAFSAFFTFIYFIYSISSKTFPPV
jgi:hypothetical protein